MEQYDGLYPRSISATADVAGARHGEINFANISQKLDELGYDGLIGMECFPSTTEEALHPYEVISRGL